VVTVRGSHVLVATVGLVALFMAGVWFASQGLRQDYHVLSPGDVPRPDADLGPRHAVWLEQHGIYGASEAFPLAQLGSKTAKPIELESQNASLQFPILTSGKWAAWVEGAGPFRVRAWDLDANRSIAIGDAGDNLTLPGRTMEGPRLVALGAHAGRTGAWIVTLPDDPSLPAVLAPLDLPAEARAPLRLAGGMLWGWTNGSATNATIRGWPLDGSAPLAFDAGGPVVSLDSDGRTVAWTRDLGKVRGVAWRDVANGTAGATDPRQGDQHDPAVDEGRVIYIGDDTLVHLRDLVTGKGQVLPARDEENVHLRLLGPWALWLSGTLQGHNVFLTPAPAAGAS
jgi:hypothetical protein